MSGSNVDLDALTRVFSKILPIASDNYDNAIEHLSRARYTLGPGMDAHFMASVEDAFRAAFEGVVADAEKDRSRSKTGALAMLSHMQQALLSTADAIRHVIEQYRATDEAAARRLMAAHTHADTVSGPHPVEGQG